MKHILIWALYAGVAVFATGCYKDKGNYSYRQDMPFVVDTVGQATSFSVQKDVTVLSIDPKIVYDGDAGKLQYLWRLYSTSQTNTRIDTLSNEKVLAKTVSRPPGNYQLELQVTDSRSTVKAAMIYTVTVSSPFPYGWMVFYEKDGNSEMGLIRTNDIIFNLPKDTVMLNAYETINKRKLVGKPFRLQQSGRMWFGGEGFGAYVIYALTSQGGVMMDYVSFDYLSDYMGMFLSKPSVIKPMGINGEIGMMSNNGQLYTTSLLSPFFTGPAIESNKGYEVDSVSFVATDYNVYDQKNMRFLEMSSSSLHITEFLPANAPGALFDLSNIGKELLFQENGYSSYRYAFFKDPSGNGRYLYVINFNGQYANPRNPSVGLVDLSAAPGIQDAKFFAVSSRGPVAFYANINAVYKTSTLTNSATVAFDQFAAGEEITSMKLFKNTGSGYSSANTRESQIMFVATWNNNTQQGFVYLLPVNEVSGQVNTANIKKFTGFGRIADMNLKAN
jgi:hypothetical protein